MRRLKSFITLFKAEHYKTRNNIALLLFLLLPIVLMIVVNIYIIIETGSTEYNYNPWVTLLGKYISVLYFVYPFLISILISSLCEMEYQNKNFRRLFTLPYSALTIYISKILFLVEVIFLSVLLVYFSFMTNGFIMGHIRPALAFQDYDIRLACFYLHIRIFIGLFAISLIQYCINLLFRNFVVPVSFACFMTVFSAIFLNNWKYNYFIPYRSVSGAFIEFIKYQYTSFNNTDYICFASICIFFFINYHIMIYQKNA